MYFVRRLKFGKYKMGGRCSKWAALRIGGQGRAVPRLVPKIALLLARSNVPHVL